MAQEQPLTEAELAALRKFDTPTVCNALEILVPERRILGFTTRSMHVARPQLPPIVGYARTATVRAMQPPSRDKATMRAQRFAYFDYIAEGPSPRIMVIQDLDSQRGMGAFWGEVQSNVHKALGCLGGITDGGIRDLDMLAEGFQLLAGEIVPSHAWTHLVDYGIQVNIFGMTVQSGDLIHADRHGAVVIPHAVARKVPATGDLLARREAVILDAVKAKGFQVADLKKAIADADEIH
jgi:regulator of RNase E activity RraA